MGIVRQGNVPKFYQKISEKWWNVGGFLGHLSNFQLLKSMTVKRWRVFSSFPMTHEFQLFRKHFTNLNFDVFCRNLFGGCKRRKTILVDAKKLQKTLQFAPKNHGRHAKKKGWEGLAPLWHHFSRAILDVRTEAFSRRSPPVMQTWCRSSAHKPGYAEVDLEVWNGFLPVK